MMQVTRITELSKSRSKVYLEQQFSFVLYKGELRRYHIREGEEISEETYRAIWQEILPKRAKLRCMNLLQSREYTRQQLYTKLKQGFYPEEIIEEALDYVASFHYIDDLRYAQNYIAYRADRLSRRRIEQDLDNKGIDKETVQRAWLEWEEDGNSQDEMAAVRKLLQKKNYDSQNADKKEQQRVYAFLMRKGYSSEIILKAMKIL